MSPPLWSGCNRRWCVYGISFGNGVEIMLIRIDKGLQEATYPYFLHAYVSPTNPSPRKTLVGTWGDDSYNGARYYFKAADADQILER